MKRVQNPVSLNLAKERLLQFENAHPHQIHRAATLAEVIWPDEKFRAAQGAGAAASRVLKRLGCQWDGNKSNWGWRIIFKQP
jgi:hypothetical protein